MRSPSSGSARTGRRLEEAVAAFREALKERTRERAPREWATTQDDLDIALVKLGEHESGSGRFEEAIAVFREALKGQSQERAPREWAATRDDLDIALVKLGEREYRAGRLEEAGPPIARR